MNFHICHAVGIMALLPRGSGAGHIQSRVPSRACWIQLCGRTLRRWVLIVSQGNTRRGARCEDFERVRKPERDGAGGHLIPFCFFFLSLPALTFSLKARSDLSLTSLDSAGGPAAKFISGSECEGGQRINAAQLGSARGQIKHARSQVAQTLADECEAGARARSKDL